MYSDFLGLIDPLLGAEMIRVVLAVVLGAVVGVERSISGKAAGMRTFALVSLGSCLFMLVSEYYRGIAAGPFSFDPTRIAAGIITGIGFLGAGIIIFQKELKGLTTAAGLWVTAGIGVAIGSGLYGLALLTALVVVAIYRLLWYLEEYLEVRLSSEEHSRPLSLERIERDVQKHD